MAGETGPAVAAPSQQQGAAQTATGEETGGSHDGGMLQPWYARGPIPPVASGSAAPSKPTASEQAYGTEDQTHTIDVTPARHRFEPVEVGGISEPLAVTFVNHRQDFVEIERVEIGKASFGSARPHDFDLVTPVQAGPWSSGAKLVVEVAHRPSEVGNIQSHLTLYGHTHDGTKVSRGIPLLGTGAKPKPENADRRELSIAKRNARDLERASHAPITNTYAEMLAAVLAAQDLTKRDDDDDRRHAQLLLGPVQKRMQELEPISYEKLRGFGFGNTTGHFIFSGAHDAIDTWIRKLQLGSSIATDPFVTQFRVGAEAIRLCTGERKDAPNLENVGEVGKETALIGTAAIAAAPVVIGLLTEEAGLLAFTTRLAGRRVLTWALLHPAQALAASEALIGFGVQIGQDGWDTFWDQLHDPRGFTFIAMQIAMDVMHVHSSGSGRSSTQPQSNAPSPAHIGEIKTRIQGVRQTIEQVEQQVATEPVPGPKGGGANDDQSTVTAASKTATRSIGRSSPQEDGRDSETTAASSERSQSMASSSRATSTPEFPVQRSELRISAQRSAKEWAFEIKAPLPNGRVEIVAQGTVLLDAEGRPVGGPDFYIAKDAHVGGVAGKIQVYEGQVKLSLTDYTLDEAINRFRAEFGHPPESLPGHLAFENKLNFQREYAMALCEGKSVEDAKQVAIRKISFGRSRIARGYDQFKVETGNEGQVNLGEPFGAQRVPTTIEVEAKRSTK